jgi:hypothetical protein
MFWFIKNAAGLYYHGGTGDRVSWQTARTGAPTFPTEKSAQDRIDELGLEDATPEEY